MPPLYDLKDLFASLIKTVMLDFSHLEAMVETPNLLVRLVFLLVFHAKILFSNELEVL